VVPILSLCIPILVSAVIVFFASWLMHMLLPVHKSDFAKLPSEDEVADALRKFNIPPGDYMMPRPAGPQDMRSPEYLAKMNKGPVALLTFMKPGPPNMGANLLQWFIYLLVVGVLVAYVTGRTHGPGTPYLQVFRIAGCVAFIAHSVAMWQDSIWYKRAWSTVLKYTFDGLIYGLLTAGTFGWLWPK
jgi:hypothetical protein